MMHKPLCRSYVAAWVVLGLAGGSWAQEKAAAAGRANPGYALVSAPVKRVRGELTLKVEVPKLDAEQWFVYAARLPELPGQVAVQSTLSPKGRPGRELSEEGRPILAARLTAQEAARHGFEVRLVYEATLLSRNLVKLAPGERPEAVPALDARTRRLALAEGDEFDFRSAPFRDWLDEHKLRRGPKEGEIDFARRAFLEMRRSFTYLFTDNMDRLASHVCRDRRSDCGGMSIAFASALRANGIPARVLTGRWALSSEADPAAGTSYAQQHVKAEFFAEGVGWVPADLACGVVHDKSPQGLRFFGRDEGDFVTFHVGTTMVFDTTFGRKPVEWLQEPAFWVTGSGTFDGETRLGSWVVRSEPIELREAVFRKPANPPRRVSPGRRRP